MRLDKYLKVSRIIKRRTVANEACDSGRVMLNDKVARASADVKVGDVIEIAFGNKSVKVRITSGVGMRCKAKGVPAVAIVGGMGNGAEKIYEFGVESIVPTINGAMDIEEALERAEELYANAADRTFRMIRVGMQMK